MLFTPFKKATRPETPGFAEAELAEGNFKQSAKDRSNALRSQNLLGGAALYNAGMGERSPIADYMFGPAAAPAAAEGATAVAGGTELAPLLTQGAAGSGALATPVVAGGAAPAATGALAGGGAGAGSSALAGMGPAGWSALAAMALLSLT